MAKAQGKVKIEWSPEFAYAIGLLVTDGNLSPDGRHFNFTSKDIELAELFKNALGLTNTIGRKARGGETEKKYYVIQFGDVLFYSFCVAIGLHPNKSKTLGRIKIPRKYFFDFVRGCFDGDGSFYSYWDPRWKSSFMYYVSFASSSKDYVRWMQSELKDLLKITGHITIAKSKSCEQLKYAKKESLLLLHAMYNKKGVICLSRKRLKIKAALGIMRERL
jgi:intein-encoded DNA endonuclease-like protein